MVFVDTVFLLALVNRRCTSEPRLGRELTTEYVLWELVNALSTPVDRPKAHALIDRIRTASDWELVPASARLFEAGLSLHAKRVDKEWSLTDCISFQVMESRQLSRALTYDSHFEQAGFHPLLRSAPSAAAWHFWRNLGPAQLLLTLSTGLEDAARRSAAPAQRGSLKGQRLKPNQT